MQKIKKYTPILLLFSLLLPLFFVGAQDPLVQSGDDIIQIFNNILNWLWRMFLVVTVIAFLIAGFMYVTSAGDSDKISTATRMIKYGIIGIVVALFAAGMVSIIESLLTEAT